MWVMVFANGKWTQSVERTRPCGAGGTGHAKITEDYPLPLPPQDPITVLTGRGRLEATGSTGCDGVRDFDEKLERTGD
jgi:serine/threonine-protein kinase